MLEIVRKRVYFCNEEFDKYLRKEIFEEKLIN